MLQQGFLLCEGRDTWAAGVGPGLDSLSTDIVLINAMLPRRHCLKAASKPNETMSGWRAKQGQRRRQASEVGSV